MGNEVKWIKFMTNMFEEDYIDFIESMPESDAILVIWCKLLCLAGKCNAGGYLFLTEQMPYTEEMLAHKFRQKQRVIELALRVFRELGMIQTDNKGIFVPYIAENHDHDKLEKMREKNRNRVRAFRDRQRALLDSCNADCNVTGNDTETLLIEDQIEGCNGQSNVTGNVTVTDDVMPCNAVDIDIDIDKEKDIKNIVEHLNLRTSKKFKPSSKKTKRLIKARLSEGFTFDDFITVIDKKAKEWLGTDWDKYLRPETLFGTKFEGYLNQSESQSTPTEEAKNKLNIDFSRFREN